MMNPGAKYLLKYEDALWPPHLAGLSSSSQVGGGVLNTDSHKSLQPDPISLLFPAPGSWGEPSEEYQPRAQEHWVGDLAIALHLEQLLFFFLFYHF